MQKFMLGRKAGMTQIYDEEGVAIPVSVIDCGPLTVLQNKTVEKDGYQALQVAYEPYSKGNKPHKGQFKKLGLEEKRFIREFRDTEEKEAGSEIKLEEMLSEGDLVAVSGISKGKGYQGAIRRHGQSRGPMMHGSKYHRHAGSMGPSATPSRVMKGKKMPGQLGNERVTVRNLKVVKVDAERHLLLVHGAVPGARGSLLEIVCVQH